MPTLVKLILFAPVTLFKILRLLYRARKHRKDPDRYSLQKRSNFVLKECLYVLFMFNLKLDVFNYENLPKMPFLIAANHNDYLDIIITIAAMKKQSSDKNIENLTVTFLAKKELMANKIIYAGCSLLDVVFIERENIRDAVKGLDRFAAIVKQNKTVGVIFPEGTRSKNGELGHFKSGIFKIAQRHLLSIVPTTINFSKRGLKVGRKKKETVEIEFHQVIKGTSTLNLKLEALSDKVKETIASSLKNIGDQNE